MTTTWTGTVGAIAADLVAAPTDVDPHAVDLEATYVEVWTPLGELRIPRHVLPDHQVGDTVTITIEAAE